MNLLIEAVSPRVLLVSDSVSTREHTAILWLFGVLTVGGLCLVLHAAVYAASVSLVVVAAGPAVITGMLAFISWYARREARAAAARADADDLAAANEREDQLGR